MKAKIATNLEQSIKLAKILPLDSADMVWNVCMDDTKRLLPKDDWDAGTDGNRHNIPAWSLSALLNTIPFVTIMKDEEGWYVECENGTIAEWNTELVDACVEILLKLHEKNLL